MPPRRSRRTGTAFIEDERDRDITFSKRRHGLFNAVSNLSILTGASIAVVMENRARNKFHAIGTPTVQAVVDAALSDNMEATRPLVDEQQRARLAPLENELARLKEEEESHKEKTQASKDRYKEAKAEAEENGGDDDDVARMNRLLFSRPDDENLSLDEMKGLFAEMLQYQKQARELVPSDLGRRGGGDRLMLGSSSRARAPLPPPPPPPPRRQAANPVPWQPLQWPNLYRPRNQLLPAAEGSIQNNSFPTFSMGPFSFGSQSQQAPPAHDNTQLAPLPQTLEQQGPLMQQPFLFSDHAPTVAAAPLPLQAPLHYQSSTVAAAPLPLQAPLQMPVENHFPQGAPLLQVPFPFSGQASALAPLPTPLQMMPTPRLQLSPLMEEQFPLSDEAPRFAPIPAPSLMPVQPHFSHPPLPQEPLPLSNPTGPALASAPMPAPLQNPVEDHFPLSPMLQMQKLFDFSDQAPLFSPPPPSPLQTPMEAPMPLEAPLIQQPFQVPDQAPIHAPPQEPLQMPVDAHMPLNSPLVQEPFLHAPLHAPPQPAPLQMPVEADLPPTAEAYNQEVAEQQHPPEGYENYDHMFENIEPSQPLAAGAGDDNSFTALGNGNDNPFNNQQWSASPLYDGQFYMGTGIDDMGIVVGDHGGVAEDDWANVEESSSSGLGNDIFDDLWF
uniref:MADS-box domain-containing protein n=1 Tax=Leersia perrieri TaxID=77586 RepID=A0A0D9WYE9_9ORYZ